MAVVKEIALIQHRQGTKSQLPVLEEASLGFVHDVGELFIGAPKTNAVIDRTSPPFSNVQILTELSKNLEIINYEYNGPLGHTPQNTVSRTLQTTLDDYMVSVKGYGAQGDGSTDDSQSIQNALNDLYLSNDNAETKRVLYFPAGDYVIESTIFIPPDAYLVGEGKNRSNIIVEVSSGFGVGFKDSNGINSENINYGSSGATRPQNIVVQGMSFVAEEDVTLVSCASLQNSAFIDCLFKSSASFFTPSVLMNTAAAFSTVSINVVFDGCEFNPGYLGLHVNGLYASVRVKDCFFSNIARQGILFNAPNAPQTSRDCTVSNSLFNSVGGTGFYPIHFGEFSTDCRERDNHFVSVNNTVLQESTRSDSNTKYYGTVTSTEDFNFFMRGGFLEVEYVIMVPDTPLTSRTGKVLVYSDPSALNGTPLDLVDSNGSSFTAGASGVGFLAHWFDATGIRLRIENNETEDANFKFTVNTTS